MNIGVINLELPSQTKLTQRLQLHSITLIKLYVFAFKKVF